MYLAGIYISILIKSRLRFLHQKHHSTFVLYTLLPFEKTHIDQSILFNGIEKACRCFSFDIQKHSRNVQCFEVREQINYSIQTQNANQNWSILIINGERKMMYLLTLKKNIITFPRCLLKCGRICVQRNEDNFNVFKRMSLSE